jgi:dimethylamine corrinoid protein
MNYYRRMIEQPLAPLIDALLEGDQEQAISEALRVRQNGIGHELIIGGAIETAMGRLDAKCTLEQFNLLEIMLVGRAVTGVMKALYPETAPPPTKCTIVLASLEGDIHDLGKNIVKTLLSAKGYRVVDCGKDCPVELLVNTADQEQARVIGISGLITSVIPLVRKVSALLRARGLTRIQVVAGGAALKQSSAAALEVDFLAQSAFDFIRFLEQDPEQGS